MGDKAGWCFRLGVEWRDDHTLPVLFAQQLKSRLCERLATRRAATAPNGRSCEACTIWGIMRSKCGRSSA